MRTMQSTIVRWLGMGLLLTTTGCSPFVPEKFGWPNLLHPGGFAYQRWRAEVFDPYPATDVGPTPAGMRPTWYDTPSPLPQRTFDSARLRFGPVPPKESPVMP
jgi:hypothetical protein